MKKRTNSTWRTRFLFAAIAIFTFLFAANSLAVAQNANYKTGEKLEVDSKGVWYPAEVIEVKDGFYKIHYSGYGSQWDEWVDTSRMRRPGEPAPPKRPTDEAVQKQTTAKNVGDKNLPTFKPGDRVECDKASIDSWEKGTVMPFLKNDDKSGITYRVRLDAQARGGMYLDGIICMTNQMRLLAGAAPYKTEATAVPVGKATVDEDNTLSADRPILECPVKQTPVENGARPNAELLKKIIRCRKGEKPAGKGYDGAVTVDVTALQIGAPRSWIYAQDIGGKPGTIIYPVKATFHYKTFYRSSTEVSQNWIRILNFYVDAFGDWAIGSEESVKVGETINIPRNQ